MKLKISMPKSYPETDRLTHLSDVAGWTLRDGAIHRTSGFDTLALAIAFADKVANIAESANHHPDIDIRYTKVRLTLVSHYAGGLIDRDFAMTRGNNDVA